MKATAGSNVQYPTGFNPSWGPNKAINGDLDDQFHFLSQHGAKFGWMAVDLKKICKVLLFIVNCQAQVQSQIQVPNPGPKSNSKIQNPKSKGKGIGLGLTL